MIKRLSLVIALICSFCIAFSAFATDKAVQAVVEKPTCSGMVNINTATQEQLETLPRIGEKIAQAIIEYRTQNGSFKNVEDIANVKGIGEKTLDMLKPFIAIDGETTFKQK